MIYIKVLKYKGKSGGFAQSETDRWSVSLVNEEKEMEISLNSSMSEGFGFSERRYAMERAQPYADLLGLPIVEKVRKAHVTYTEEAE